MVRTRWVRFSWNSLGLERKPRSGQHKPRSGEREVGKIPQGLRDYYNSIRDGSPVFNIIPFRNG
jgi:hypothetical protein